MVFYFFVSKNSFPNFSFGTTFFYFSPRFFIFHCFLFFHALFDIFNLGVCIYIYIYIVFQGSVSIYICIYSFGSSTLAQVDLVQILNHIKLSQMLSLMLSQGGSGCKGTLGRHFGSNHSGSNHSGSNLLRITLFFTCFIFLHVVFMIFYFFNDFCIVFTFHIPSTLLPHLPNYLKSLSII